MDAALAKKEDQFIQIAHWEGISFLLLLGIAMPLKHFFHIPVAVSIVGAIHGLLFIAFCYYLFVMLTEVKWSFKRCVIAFLLGFLPAGTFFIRKSPR
ncbi:MAG: DUF3817 domain-containing protein [Bacteroidetes bacterium]|nr:DUF3817 domain-containing protein [Bacteroidota bacterium]